MLAFNNSVLAPSSRIAICYKLFNMASHGFVLSLTHTMTSLLAGHHKFTKRRGCMHALLLYKTLSVFCTAHTRHHTPWHRKRRPRPPRFSARLQLCHGATVRSYCPSPVFNGLIGLEALQKPYFSSISNRAITIPCTTKKYQFLRLA